MGSSVPIESPAHNAGYDISLHLFLLSAHDPTARLVFLNHFDFLHQSTHETLHAEHKTSLLKMNLKLNPLFCRIFSAPREEHGCLWADIPPPLQARDWTALFFPPFKCPPFALLPGLLRLRACPPRFPSTRSWCCRCGQPLSLWWLGRHLRPQVSSPLRWPAEPPWH